MKVEEYCLYRQTFIEMVGNLLMKHLPLSVLEKYREMKAVKMKNSMKQY